MIFRSSILRASVLARFIFTLFIIASVSALPDSPARAKDLSIQIDEAKLVRLKIPAAQVIVGNPSIADVSVQKGKILAVTGKSFGLTNIIVLDEAGKEILSKKVSVAADTTRIVTMHKGSRRTSLYCTPMCQNPLVVGDEVNHFEALRKEVNGKFATAATAVDSGRSGE